MKKRERSFKVKSIAFNFSMNIALRVSTIAFQLITMPYINRVLGVTNIGKVTFATSVISYFSMFAQLGIPMYGIRSCAQCRDDKEQLSKTVLEILLINMVAVGIAYCALIVCMITIPKFQEYRTLLLIISLTILLNSIGIEWLYQAIEQYQYITIRNILFKFIAVVLTFMLVKKQEDYMIYSVITVFASFASNILNLINSRKYILLRRNMKFQWKRHAKPIITFSMLSIAVSMYLQMDTVMLGFLSNDTQVGYYNVSTKVKLILATMISALGPVIFPRVSYYLKNNQQDRFLNIISKSLHFVILVAVPVVIYFILMSKESIMFLGGKDYVFAIPSMRVILLAIIPLSVGNVASMQILAPSGREKLTMYSTICGAITNLIGNVILIPHTGALGAAIATVLAESIVAAVQIYFTRDIIIPALKMVQYTKMLIAVMISTAMLFAVMHIEINYMMKLIFTAVVFFGFYGGILVLLKEKLVYQYAQLYANRFLGRNNL